MAVHIRNYWKSCWTCKSRYFCIIFLAFSTFQGRLRFVGQVRNQKLSLFQELKRRHVFKASIAYIIVAWLILQVSDIMLDIIEAPGWVSKVVLLFLAIGFPLIVMFAWAFDMTPDGLKRTEAAGEPAPHRTLG